MVSCIYDDRVYIMRCTMKKIKLIILTFIFTLSFLIGVGYIKAADLTMTNVSGDCSKYFTIRDVTYSEGKGDLVCAKQAYVAGELRVWMAKDGIMQCSDKLYKEDDKVTSAWYFQTEEEGTSLNKSKHFKDNVKLTIQVLIDNNVECEADITGFNTKKDHVKVALNHDGKIQNVTLRGTFHNGNYSDSATMFVKVANLDAGTQKANKTKKAITDENGNIVESQTSCTDVRAIIHDYWKYVMIIVPILLIVVITLDFFKAMVSNDQDAIKKASTNAVKRTIAAVILLALPALLSYILGLFGLELCI